MNAPLRVSREQILAFRRRTQALDERLPYGPDGLRHASWAGLQDSVPRSALHALHARVEGVPADALDDPALVQVWGPRFVAYVVPATDHLPFTLGRMPPSGRMPARATDLAARLAEYLDGRTMRADEAARGIGVGNAIRYAALTGTVLIRWHGAREPTVWTIPASQYTAAEALQELARRYLHVLGPSTLEAFVRWGGIDGRAAFAAIDALGPELLTVRSPLGDAQVLAEDAPILGLPLTVTEAARLLPSGDPYYLLWGADRGLLVPDAKRAAELWTTRVWPGALLLGGEIAGVWRRSKSTVIVTPWRTLTTAERAGVEAEAASLPLPDVAAAGSVQWEDAAA